MENPDFVSSLIPLEKTLPNRSAKVASSLSHLLSATQKLCRQSLYSQCRTSENEVTALHSLFEHHYQSLRKAADTIADRLRMLGYTPREVRSWGAQGEDAQTPEEMFRSMLVGHQTCAREAKRVMTAAEAAGDDTSQHIAEQRFAIHDRAARLLIALMQTREPIHS